MNELLQLIERTKKYNKLARALSRDELHISIRATESKTYIWVRDENRKDIFEGLLNDCGELGPSRAGSKKDMYTRLEQNELSLLNFRDEVICRTEESIKNMQENLAKYKLA